MPVQTGKMPTNEAAKKKVVARGFRKKMAKATGIRHFWGKKSAKHEPAATPIEKVHHPPAQATPEQKAPTEESRPLIVEKKAASPVQSVSIEKVEEKPVVVAKKAEEEVASIEKVEEKPGIGVKKVEPNASFEDKDVVKKPAVVAKKAEEEVASIEKVEEKPGIGVKKLEPNANFEQQKDIVKKPSVRRLPEAKSKVDEYMMEATAKKMNEEIKIATSPENKGKTKEETQVGSGESMLDFLAKKSREKVMTEASSPEARTSPKKKRAKEEEEEAVGIPAVFENVCEEKKRKKTKQNEDDETKDSQPIFVVDAGAWKTRVGLAGDETARVEVETIVGRRKSTLGGEAMPEFTYGNSARRASTVYDLSTPVSRGLIINWDDAEGLWSSAFIQVREETKLEPRACLIAGGVLQPKASIQKLAELCFERLGFDAFHAGVAPVLALFGAGYTTGLVLDCGKDSARAVPVYDGFALPHAICIDTCLGGNALDAAAARILETKSLSFKNNENALLAGQACKHQVGLVPPPNIDIDDTATLRDIVTENKVLLPIRTLSKSSRDSRASSIDPQSGDMIMTLDPRECATIGETLFKPQIHNSAVESLGLAGLVFKAISATEIDLRKSFYEGVLLVGAGSLLPNTAERLDYELQHLAPQNAPVEVTAYEERDQAAFHGAAMVSSLDDFNTNWILKTDAQDPVTLDARIKQTSYGC